MVRSRALAVVMAAASLAALVAGCGRSDGSSGAQRSTSTSTTAASHAGNRRDFGTLRNVCQGGDAKGATAPGVTGDSIHVATFSDTGFAGRPGLNQELFDSAEVFSKWCNDAGGINGRKIAVDERDAALTNYKPKVLESCGQDFAMVGGGAVFDDTGQEDRLRCLLPDFSGYLVTAEARGADLTAQAVPAPLTALGIGDYRWLGRKYRASTQHVGVLAGSLPTLTTVAKEATEAVQHLGWRVVYDDQYPVAPGAVDWSPYVQTMKDKGVRGLIWVGEPENLAKLAQAMANANYRLDWIRTDPNHYDKKLVDLGGAIARNIYVTSTFAPFESALRHPATRQYLDTFAKYKPSAKAKAYLGLQAWSAWLLFAQAARDCGADLTRKCVFDNAKKVKEWTGGGLHGATDPADTRGSSCFVLFRTTPKGFETVDVAPNTGIYNCGSQNTYTLKGNYGTGATLASVGKTLADLR